MKALAVETAELEVQSNLIARDAWRYASERRDKLAKELSLGEKLRSQLPRACTELAEAASRIDRIAFVSLKRGEAELRQMLQAIGSVVSGSKEGKESFSKYSRTLESVLGHALTPEEQ